MLLHIQAHEIVSNAGGEPSITPRMPGQEASKELLGYTQSHGFPCLIHLVNNSVTAQKIHTEIINKTYSYKTTKNYYLLIKSRKHLD